MEDMDLQFDMEVPFDSEKKTKKPFPGDFSFNAEGLLEDCEVEELPETYREEPQESLANAVEEEFYQPFTDTAFEDIILPEEALEEDLDEESPAEEPVAVETLKVLDDESFDSDEDDLALWDEFKSVFEEVEEEPEEDAGTEPETAEAPLFVVEPETEATPEEAESDAEMDEDDESDEELLSVFDAEFSEEETEPEIAEAPLFVVEPETEAMPEPEETPESFADADEADEEAEADAETEEDVESESAEEPERAEETETSVEVTSEVDTTPDLPFVQEEEEDEDFDFPEDPDTECDFVAVPKPTVSVTTWERVRQRARAQKNQNTYETEHFFAVEEEYSENAAFKAPTPAEQVMGITKEARCDADDGDLEAPVQPIWQIHEPGEPEDLNVDVSEEELDYDDIFNDDRTAFRKKKKRKNIFKKILKEFLIFLAIVVGALVLVTNFTIFVSRQNTVVGESMEPTLHGGDHVYTSMLPYIFGDPKVGDIVVFDYSYHKRNEDVDMSYFHMVGEVLKNNRLTQIFRKDKANTKLDEYWIKRVVAVAGDTVAFQNNQFIRNGEVVQEDYILDQTVMNYDNGDEIVVPKGCVFVMGDNRNNSTDSRIIGCVDIDIITGKVWKR
ncbi:MAG: signal peptidase I [Clostridia bacterium]|nr:signal peptidase I [Clostridia bacterium]